ncbi:MAG TPA: bifunctional diaminohydroxyphosphoribosylaminopyrimidine deaminase/5-amino-6-(5-phosphoribosylamino)uracil reductase RibD [Xanthobacteraceae bacterium]|nr:bifunctional diaminohydroxyphosphoribosylaminopyrimidine deaminase/5-amino-6-(5-phosphoribosylamino)uracil reductase RibD [Xanthobacteraceae bacterium]
MALALALGRRGLGNAWPNPAVGAVIVRNEPQGPVVVGRGWTQPGGRPHAEVEALRRAGAAARGATIYTTLEPCSHFGRTPPCADAIIAAGIARVVSALDDPNPDIAGEGYRRLRARGIAVVTGVGAAEARRVHAGHVRRMRDGRPHVMLKLAVSSDGKAGLAGRRPAAITGEPARERVHRLRAMYDAVLIGIGTALADDPLLTCRLPGMATRSPARVVLDSGLRLPPDSKVVRSAREIPLWVLAAPDAAPARADALQQRGAEVMRVDGAGGRRDLAATLKCLATRGITRLMVEGGPTVAAAFLAADLLDEAVLLRAPVTIGADGIAALEGLPLTALTQSPRLRSRGVVFAGADSIETFERS